MWNSSRGIIVCFFIPCRIYLNKYKSKRIQYMCIYGLVLVNIYIIITIMYKLYFAVQKTLYTYHTSNFIKRCLVQTKVCDIYEYKTMDSSSNHYRILFMNNPSRRLFLGFLADPCLIGCFVGFAKLVWLSLSWVVKIRLVQQVLDA